MPRSLSPIPLALAVALCSAGVLAQDAAEFTALSACRIDEDRVLLRATFDGSACQSVEPAGLAEPRGTIVAVTIPTTRTAEVCTMQIVPVEVEQVIEAPEPIFDLDVTALDPDNNPIAHGVIELDETEADCTAPEG
ncbi:hypothetical protein VE25_01845 [Devosia geojensis]|uniref:Uncharacterized protein n=1 Tax=Devosia geojensis TaxID=443610 RepID=A0A0F5FZ60_9HYPH|nr:hypothetical protein [Devosia geojensis]KKB13492.1 hypothetical protein VE25_01845 [Devosia geojensis]